MKIFMNKLWIKWTFYEYHKKKKKKEKKKIIMLDMLYINRECISLVNLKEIIRKIHLKQIESM